MPISRFHGIRNLLLLVEEEDELFWFLSLVLWERRLYLECDNVMVFDDDDDNTCYLEESKEESLEEFELE